MLRDLSMYFLRLGALGFGGPIALAGAMQRDLVEERGWITEQDYKEGLALAQLAPGPLAAQLAMYLGWVVGGVRGATLVGLAFVDGVTAAATGAIAGAGWVLGRRSLVDGLSIAIALVTLVILMRVRRIPEPLVVLAAGVAGLALGSPGGR